MGSYTVLERSQHSISRDQLSQHALKVLYRLRAKGFNAFVVGGALRDLLRDKEPRDFDIVTNASIDQIRDLFRNGKIVGKRFPIVHTYFGDQVIEISSLKVDGSDGDKYQQVAEDAARRDFTVNALYYDIEDFKLLDPLGALEDLKNNFIVAIGDPEVRFEEDPIRMLRALKLKAIHKFEFGPGLKEAILHNREHIRSLGAGRKYEEITRVFLDEDVAEILKQFQEFGLTGYFWPAGSMLINEKGPKFFSTLRETLKINASRGSYSRASHTMLWSRLFFESGVFDPAKQPAGKSKELFAQFIEPLGMPFRAPVFEALHAITAMHNAAKGQKANFETSNEVYKLLEYYTQNIEPQLRKPFRDVVKVRNSRRRRNPSAKESPRNQPQEREASPAHGGKRKRRRRRRRRHSGNRRPKSDG